VIIFGSAMFGATGPGWMPIASMDFGAPRYIFANAHTGVAEFHEESFQPARFVATGASGRARKVVMPTTLAGYPIDRRAITARSATDIRMFAKQNVG
jgi:hypothetical protein